MPLQESRSGHTFVEKALGRAAGVETLPRAGDIVEITPDLIFSHDNTAAIRKIFQTIGAPGIKFPERAAFTLDHAVPAPTVLHAQNHDEVRKWAQEQNVRLFEVGRGICHQVISEEALILPGETIIGSDSHTTHFGWLGAFGWGVGRTEMAGLWATGETWIQVPEAVQIVLSGKLARSVTAKDVMLHLMVLLAEQKGTYRSMEFAGEAISSFPIDERPVIPNMMAEFGAMNAYFPPDEEVFNYLESRRTRDYSPLYPDADADYVGRRYALDVSPLEPLVAQPHAPDNVVPLNELIGQPIQQAFIGTCTGGRLSDLAAAAEVVRGKHIKSRLIVIPASAAVFLEATRQGIIATLLEAGASISIPGCGPCMGNHMGVPADNEVTISTGSRNFRGRMGNPNAPVYLANPYVVAASAIKGAIADPREFMHE